MGNCPISFTSNNNINLLERIKTHQDRLKARINGNDRIITICYSTHRPEMVGLFEPILDMHEVIILEEPSAPEFDRVMKKEIAIKEYVESGDFTFPIFQSMLYEKIANLIEKKRITVYQVDPYIETLLSIHEIFAEGGNSADLKTDLQKKVYARERRVTGVLLRYYRSVLDGKFEEALENIINFAREDAARIRLRDSLRAKRIGDILMKKRRSHFRIFVEAGYIHLWLFKVLKKHVPTDFNQILFFPAHPVVSYFVGKRHPYTPGDILTLSLVFGKNRKDRFLLAARSLIFTKILHKHEILPANNNSFPHTMDEIECVKLVEGLSLEDCKSIFSIIKNAKSRDAKGIVKDFYTKKYGLKTLLQT